MFELIALMLLSQQPLQPVAAGTASYYTVASSGSMTASGEPMRDDLLTCAMHIGEFGDRFLIVAENGKSVVCRLNDRGPYSKKRIVDLSEAAMRELDSGLGKGVLRVKVYALGEDSPRAPV